MWKMQLLTFCTFTHVKLVGVGCSCPNNMSCQVQLQPDGCTASSMLPTLLSAIFVCSAFPLPHLLDAAQGVQQHAGAVGCTGLYQTFK
jgi:hypothetical protein